MLFRDGNQSHRCRSRHLLRPSLRSGPLVLAEVPIRLPGGCAREGESWPELGPRRLPLAPEHMEAAVVSPTFPQEGQRARCPSIPPWERDGGEALLAQSGGTFGAMAFMTCVLSGWVQGWPRVLFLHFHSSLVYLVMGEGGIFLFQSRLDLLLHSL